MASKSDSSFADIDSNSVLFTIGRMNPPTPGHKKLIQKMMKDAIQKNINIIFVNLTSTTGLKGKMNPLHCIDKKGIVQKMIVKIKDEMKNEYDSAKIEELQVIVNCADDENIKNNKSKPNQIPDLINGMKMQMGDNLTDDTNYRIYLGEKDFGKFDGFQASFGNKLISIKVKRPSGDMSATYLRNLTIKDDDKFLQAMRKLAVEQDKELGQEEIQNLRELNRQDVFVEEMLKVGLNEGEAIRLFTKIQSEIEKLEILKPTKRTKTEKRMNLGDDEVTELFDRPSTKRKLGKGGSKTKSKTRRRKYRKTKKRMR